jgi:HK97 family phage prohead protease
MTAYSSTIAMACQNVKLACQNVTQGLTFCQTSAYVRGAVGLVLKALMHGVGNVIRKDAIADITGIHPDILSALLCSIDEVSAEVKETPFRLKDFSLSDRTFEGYISTFEDPDNPDSYGDIVAPGFFADDLAERGPKSKDPRIKTLFAHDWERPIGLPVEMFEDSDGCFAKAHCPDGIPDADLALRLIDTGLWDSLSFGFEVLEYSWLEDFKDRWGYPVRKLIRGRTFEFSPVTFPANDNARIAKARKHAAWSKSKGGLLVLADDISRKAGRVISTKNLEKLVQARELLDHVISTAQGSDEDEGDKDFTSALVEVLGVATALSKGN